MRFLNVAIAVLWVLSGTASAQPRQPAPADAPNQYHASVPFGELPGGRTSNNAAGRVDVASDGTIWAHDQCGTGKPGALCISLVHHFDRSGRLLGSFEGPAHYVHRGFDVDTDGNVWLAEYGRVPADRTEGMQVYKFSPQGELLLTLGRRLLDGSPDTFRQPSDVLVAPDGQIFVAADSRIVIFDKAGKFRRAWETESHDASIAMDSAGRLFVGDTRNDRVQIFDQDGTRLGSWTQFGRPDAMFIDRNDVLYVVDASAPSKESGRPDERRGTKDRTPGIRIGSVKDGLITGYIAEPNLAFGLWIGLAVDPDGTIYRSVPGGLKKIAKKTD